MNLIPNTRTDEEKKSFPSPAKTFREEVSEMVEVVKDMSDEELSEIVTTYRISHNDYAKQQAAAHTLRGRTPADTNYAGAWLR